MLAVGTPFFLLLPESSKKRVLHPGQVIACSEGVYTGRFDDALCLPQGADVVAFHTAGTKFMQQGAVVVKQAAEQTPPVDELTTTGPNAAQSIVSFTLVGEAVSAEQRQIYRLSVPLANIKACIGNEADCHIVDISPEGCAAITRREYPIGSIVSVTFSHESHMVSTRARVQTARPRPDGTFRYGFFVIEKGSSARKALSAIYMAIQRQQLKRLAGAA